MKYTYEDIFRGFKLVFDLKSLQKILVIFPYISLNKIESEVCN